MPAPLLFGVAGMGRMAVPELPHGPIGAPTTRPRLPLPLHRGEPVMTPHATVTRGHRKVNALRH
jgi:hypothetical protein